MSERPRRARRSQLAVPGSSEKMMEKAAASAADHVFLDLEDAVAPVAKPEARGKIVTALKTLDWGRKTRCVRINDLGTSWCHDDVIEVVTGARGHLDTIMIPKVLRASDVLFVDTLLSQLEAKLKLEKRIGLEVLIEEVEGLQNVDEIARSCPRLEAIIFGMGDYSASMGVDILSIGGTSAYPGDIWHYARFRLVMAARAAGIDAIDGPFGNFKDDEGYRTEAIRAKTLGCVGKWAIHPSQIRPALEIFSPAQKDVDLARKMAAAYAEAEAKGLGSISVDGMMVDAASIRILNNVIRRADLIGM